MRSRVLALVAAAVLLTSLAACGDDGQETASDRDKGKCDFAAAEAPAREVTPPPADPSASGDVAVTMTTSIGDFNLTLDAAKAPCTVTSFVSLVEQDFFDQTSCHRMTTSPQFKVLQCGDPTGTGMGGPGYGVPAEWDGTEQYTAGVLAMARAQDPNSGGSQFFIVYGDTALNPEYTVFGTVDQETVARIAKAAEAGIEPMNGLEDGAPKTPVTIEGAVTG